MDSESRTAGELRRQLARSDVAVQRALATAARPAGPEYRVAPETWRERSGDEQQSPSRTAFWRGVSRIPYETLRVWEMPVDTVLAAGVGTLPLAPLAAGAASRLEEIVDRMDRRVHADVQSGEAADIWAATYVLLGLSYPAAVGQALLKRVRTMEESVTYQEILNKGEARGEAKGLINGARRVLLTFGSRRFGAPPADVFEKINSLTDFDRLERLTERVPEVVGWDELLSDE